MALKKRRAPPGVQEDVVPNLVPMVDIMFLLLLFLMLGADMGQREFEDVILPTAAGVKEDKDRDKEGVTIVNVYHNYEGRCVAKDTGGICTERSHWKIGVRGVDFDGNSIGSFIASEVGLTPDHKGPTPVSEHRVSIRADQSALYEYVQKVITACAYAGVYKIEIGAAEKMSG
jgi:biopolymer transport protein ExbD